MDDTDENSTRKHKGIAWSRAAIVINPDTLGPKTFLKLLGVCFKNKPS